MTELHLGNETRAYVPKETGKLTSVSKTQIEWMERAYKINIVQRNHSDRLYEVNEKNLLT
jgi:hypothetical protein